MVVKRYSCYISTELTWRLYQTALFIEGYRIQLAHTKEALQEVYYLRGEVYASQGYFPSTFASKGLHDDFDPISISWLLRWHEQAVGTIRVTPLKFGKAIIFRYFQGAEEFVGKRKDVSVEVGRLALLKEHRGGFLPLALLLVAYRWSLRHGYRYLIWGGGSWLYRWIRRIVPDIEMKEVGVTEMGLAELGGYFHKYRPRVYIVPVCKARLKEEAGRLLVNFLSKMRSVSS